MFGLKHMKRFFYSSNSFARSKLSIKQFIRPGREALSSLYLCLHNAPISCHLLTWFALTRAFSKPQYIYTLQLLQRMWPHIHWTVYREFAKFKIFLHLQHITFPLPDRALPSLSHQFLSMFSWQLLKSVLVLIIGQL